VGSIQITAMCAIKYPAIEVSLRRPKLLIEEVKRLMKKKKKTA